MSEHTWKMYGSIEACGACGICRRADGQNKHCPGMAPIVTVRTVPGLGDAFVLPNAVACSECSTLLANVAALTADLKRAEARIAEAYENGRRIGVDVGQRTAESIAIHERDEAKAEVERMLPTYEAAVRWESITADLKSSANDIGEACHQLRKALRAATTTPEAGE